MGIRCFISQESLALHKEHLSSLRAQKGLCTSVREAERIEKNVLAHELYFSSFRRERVPCPRIKEGYHSENRFCFALMEYAGSLQNVFLFIYPMVHFPYVGFDTNEKHLSRAVLAVDLWEHAYFLDYGFDRESYLRAALSHLDFSKLA